LEGAIVSQVLKRSGVVKKNTESVVGLRQVRFKVIFLVRALAEKLVFGRFSLVVGKNAPLRGYLPTKSHA
jgi:hypothetical protein